MKSVGRWLLVASSLSSALVLTLISCGDNVASFDGLDNEERYSPGTGGFGTGTGTGPGTTTGTPTGTGPGSKNDCECAAALQYDHGAACDACFSGISGAGGKCAADLNACTADADCHAAVVCVSACQGAASCVEACLESAAGNALYLATLACACGACGSSCSPPAPITCGTSADAGDGG